MKSILLLFMTLFLNLSFGEIYFPVDNPAVFNYSMPPPYQQGRISEENVDNIISKGVAQLTLSIAKFMSNIEPETENIVYAPINIAGALALVLLGANGRTFQEIANVLGLATGIDIQSKSQIVHEQMGRLLKKLDRTSSFTLGEEIKMAAAIFVQDDFPIRSIYKQMSESVYRSETLNLDFKTNPENARNVINAWVNERTKSKIPSILTENPPTTTKVIIASALYFNAAWEKPFFATFTKKRPFFPDGRKTSNFKMVDMMSNGGQFPYYRDTILDCEIMGFPYKDNKTTMYVVMPNHSSKQKLKDLENRLTPNDLERLVDNTRYTQSVIAFPRMKLESSIDLSGALMDLGVRTLFNPAEANLALLSPGQALINNAGFPSNSIRNPISANAANDNGILIFSRSGVPVNCTQIFDPTSNITKCEEIDEGTNKQVVYKKFGDKVGRRIARDLRGIQLTRKTRQHFEQGLDNVRLLLNADENPGLYADKVLHKVFMEITESGTEAAAATSVSLSRGGDITTFRVDQPFLFFIRNHETKTVLFWGTVNTPTPNYS